MGHSSEIVTISTKKLLDFKTLHLKFFKYEITIQYPITTNSVPTETYRKITTSTLFYVLRYHVGGNLL